MKSLTIQVRHLGVTVSTPAEGVSGEGKGRYVSFRELMANERYSEALLEVPLTTRVNIQAY